MDQEFWNKIDQWHDDDEHQKIVDEILGLSEAERDYEVNGRLAVAYNNLDQYDEAIQILEDIKEEGKNDRKWFYRMGYALYYQNKEKDAIHYFIKALQLLEENNKDEVEMREDYIDFIYRCQKEIMEQDSEAEIYNEEEMQVLDKLMDEFYQEKITRILACPEEERTYEEKIELASCYNNLSQYETAMQELEKIREEGKKDYKWNYQMGLTFFYQAQEEDSLPYFVRGLKLAEDKNADEDVKNNLYRMIDECQIAVAKKNDMAPPESYSDEELQAIQDHVEKYYGKIDGVMHELISPDIHVDLLAVAPSEERNYYQIFTMGMGAHRMDIPSELEDRGYDRAELMITLPADWKLHSSEERDYWPLRWLKILARLPIEQDTWLGWGHSIPNGEPFADNTKLSGILLVSPCNTDDGGEECMLPNGRCINFYQLIPIYEEEMEYKLKNGSRALLEKFVESEIGHVVDLCRINTCFKTKGQNEKEKVYKLSASEIRELLTDWEGADGCIATDRIVVDGCKVGYMYREEPSDQYPDSGWRFMAGDEPDSYMDNPDNSGIYKLNTICNYDEDILPLLKAKYGTAYYREEDGTFVEEEFLPLES